VLPELTQTGPKKKKKKKTLHLMEMSGNCTFQPLYPPESRYPFYRRLGGPQIRSGHFRDEKNLLPLQRFEPRTVQPVKLLRFFFNVKYKRKQ
jgi:hypothetical protein